jgi:predicted metal-dependent HD superfamily phosphohydrolase
VPIALTWLENKQWQAVKDHLGIQRDKQAFMRLVEDYGAEKMQQP